jgi:hypothetical protein
MRWKRFVSSARTRLAPLGKPRAGVYRRRRRSAPGRGLGERAAVLREHRVRRVRRTRGVAARRYVVRSAPRWVGRVAANDVALRGRGDRLALRGARTAAAAGRLKRPRRRTSTPAPVLHHVSFFYTAPLIAVPLATGDGDARPTRMPDGRRPGKRAAKAALRLAA